MKLDEKIAYVCPKDKSDLCLVQATSRNGEVVEGVLLAENGARYPIEEGIPDFVGSSGLEGGDRTALEAYDRNAHNYDNNMPITFQTIGQDELANRKKIVSKLNLGARSRVLEVGCGTGRDTVLIAELLKAGSDLYAQDLSLEMLKICRETLVNSPLHIEFARANGSALPFPDNYFDAVFHFGGLNTFTHLGKALQEMSRVARDGARVVVGDESVAPWLRSSLMGKILMHNMPLFSCEVPVSSLPENARDVSVEWVCGGFFYVIEFVVRKEEPQYNLDIPLPHGGTNRSRYFAGPEAGKGGLEELS